MIIAIASGKGGTGKTTIAVSLALSIEDNVLLLDSDVEEPNTHIFLNPTINKEEEVFIKAPQVDLKKCTFCGKCSQVCNFNAIAVLSNKVKVFTELCHSCGVCAYFCPNRAITEVDKSIGVIKFGQKNRLNVIQGQLKVGEAMPTPIIKEMQDYLQEAQHTIIDAPPGTSCSMVQSVINADYCILVTEPTPFGLHDLKLAVAVLNKLNIPFGVIINRSSLGDNKVQEYCRLEGIDILMQIPFSREIAEGYSLGKPLVDIVPEYKKELQNLFVLIKEKYGKTNSNS